MPIQVEYHFTCNICEKKGKIESHRYSRFYSLPIPSLPDGWCHVGAYGSVICCENHIVELRIDGIPKENFS